MESQLASTVAAGGIDLVANTVRLSGDISNVEDE